MFMPKTEQSLESLIQSVRNLDLDCWDKVESLRDLDCVITDEGNSILEIKNIAVAPEEQKQGLGRKLIEFVKDKFKQEYKILQVGTGDSPLTIPFYESCGFKRSHVISGFFTKNYDHPIYEAGVLLKDMVILRMDF